MPGGCGSRGRAPADISPSFASCRSRASLPCSASRRRSVRQTSPAIATKLMAASALISKERRASACSRLAARGSNSTMKAGGGPPLGGRDAPGGGGVPGGGPCTGGCGGVPGGGPGTGGGGGGAPRCGGGCAICTRSPTRVNVRLDPSSTLLTSMAPLDVPASARSVPRDTTAM